MNYNPKDIFLQRRTATGTFEESPLAVQPNAIIITDNASNLVMVDTSSFVTISSSYATTARTLLGSIESSSFAYTASHILNQPITTSYSITSSFTLNQPITTSYSITSSFALNIPNTTSFAVSASYSTTSSFALNIPNTTSFAINSLSASYTSDFENFSATNYRIPFWLNNRLTSTSNFFVNDDVYFYVNTSSYNLYPYYPALTINQVDPNSFNVVRAYGNMNSYVQIALRNSSSGNIASTDFIAEADDATESSNYIDLGIAGSGYNYSATPITKPHDGYLYTLGGDLLIGTEMVGKIIRFFVDAPVYESSSVIINSTGLHASGSLIGTASFADNTTYSSNANSASNATTSSYLLPGATLYVVSGSNGIPSSYIEPYNIPEVPYNPPYKEGRMFYDKDYSDWVYYNDQQFKLHIGKEVIWRCYNDSGAPLPKGSPVYISGSTNGTDPNIWLAIADGTNTKSDVIGVVRYTIPTGSTGYVIQNGVIHNTNMVGFSIGDPIFLSSTVLGGLTNVEPGQPYESVRIGNCQGNGINGSIIISPVFKLPPVIAYDGITSTVTITNNDNGTVTVSSGSVNLYNTPNGYGGVLPYALQETTLDLITGSTNYIVAELSASQAIYTLTTNASYANGISIVRVATLDIYTGNPPGTQWDVHIFNVGIVGLALANRTNNKDIRLYGYQRESGLTLYTTGSNKNFGITEGIIWYGPNSHAIPQFDTTFDGYYLYHFHTTSSNGTSSWTQTTSSVYDNFYYDNGTGLTALTPNYYTVNFIYRLIGTTDEAAMVLSSAEFTTSLEASNNATTPANLPSTIRDIGLLVGRIIVQSGSTTPILESAFSNTFIPATVTDHESLLGLLGGGTGGGHYHLGADDFIGTGTGLVVRRTNPTMSNPYFSAATQYHIPYWKNNNLTLTGSVQVFGDQHVLINSASFPDPTNKETLLVQQVDETSVNNIGVYSTVNNFSQIWNQNFSTGSLASTDFCAANDTGSQYENYIDMGIASSTYNNPEWPWTKAYDGYIMTNGGDLWLATTTPNKVIRFAINNTASAGYIDSNGINVTGSLIGTSSISINAYTASSIDFIPNTSISSSWTTRSISSSYSDISAIANSISFTPNTSISSSWTSQSISSSYSITASYALNSIGNSSSSSWASSSISCSNAITSSYTIGIPPIKAGLISGSVFGGNPKSSSVIFITPFISNLYSITITGEASRTWTIEGKSNVGFTINSNNNIQPSGMVFWNAIYQGEYYS